MLNVTRDMKDRPGLLPGRLYHAKVVNDNDPKKLGRIRARVEEMFDGIEDDELPWAIPLSNISNGAYKDQAGDLAVPRKDSIVMLSFQDGSPLHPIYHGYCVDADQKMDEATLHYPARIVHKLRNKGMVIIDTATNEVFIRNAKGPLMPGGDGSSDSKGVPPGTVHIHIEGDVNMEVKGNMTEKIFGNRTIWVGGTQTETIVGRHTQSLENDNVEHIKGASFVRHEDVSTTIHEKADTVQHKDGLIHSMEGDSVVSYSGNKVEHCKKDSSTIVDGSMSARVGKDKDERVLGDSTHAIKGNSSLVVESDHFQTVKGHSRIIAEKNQELVTGGDCVSTTNGNATSTVKGSVTTNADGSLTSNASDITQKASKIKLDGETNMTGGANVGGDANIGGTMSAGHCNCPS